MKRIRTYGGQTTQEKSGNSCLNCDMYSDAFRTLEAKVDLLIRELIEGDDHIGREGHLKRTERRLEDLEKRMDKQLSPQKVEAVARVLDLFKSYKFVFGMLFTLVFAVVGIGSFIVDILKLLISG